jgi:hypothetical protein
VKILGPGIIFSDIQRYLSNGQTYDKLSVLKIDKKCKHFSNFPAVTLQELR